MSTLARFKKKGGFLQLLQLIETSGVSKQEKFLSLIEEESPVWAKAVRKKMLNFDRLLKSTDKGITEIFSNINDLTLACASFGMSDEKWQRILSLVNGPKRKRLEDQKEIISPGDGEVTNSIVQILQKVREMADKDRYLYDLIDKDLRIEDNLENQLLGIEDNAKPKEVKVVQEAKNSTVPYGDADDEIFRFRKKIKDLQNEVDRLKVQNLDLKSKIEKIQKIAS